MGILAMIAGLCLLILIHEAGHWLVARCFGFQTPVFSIGFFSWPKLVLGRFWNTEFRITPWLFGGYVALPELADETTAREWLQENGQDASSYRQFAIWKRALVAAAGVTFNVIAAVLFTFLLFATYGERLENVTDVYVADLDPRNHVARDAGIKPNDVILAVDGQPVESPADLVRLITAQQGKGTSLELLISRPGQGELPISVKPGPDGRIGVRIGAHTETSYSPLSVPEAAGKALSFNAEMPVRMLAGIGMMIGIVPVPEGVPEGATDVHGVVAIVQIGAMAYEQGFYSFVMLLVLISWNLVILNILPIPVLDGGYLLLLAVEKVRGKPLPRELQGRIFMIFFVLLMALMLYGLANDIFKPVNFGD